MMGAAHYHSGCPKACCPAAGMKSRFHLQLGSLDESGRQTIILVQLEYGLEDRSRVMSTAAASAGVGDVI